MKIDISILAKKLGHYSPQIYINNQNISAISSVKYLVQDIENLDLNTLYIGDASSLSTFKNYMNPGNFLIVSEVPIPHNFTTNTNFNIVFIQYNCTLSVFNEVLYLLSECQKLIDASSILLETLSQNKGIQEIIDIGFKLIGNPIFVRDISFNILGFTQNVVVDDFVWNRITSKGYQNYDEFQYLMKNRFMEIASNAKVPIYFKNVDMDSYETLEEKIINIQIDENLRYILKPTFDPEEKVTISRVWSSIRVGNKVIGQVIALEAFKPFSDIDIALIKKLSDTISLEMQKHKYYENLSENKHDLLIIDLLDETVKDQESLAERLKFVNWNLNNPLRIITVTNHLNNISDIPLKYIRGFFENVFNKSVYCILYKGSIVCVFSCSSDKSLSDIQLKKLTQFMIDTGTYCGISRPFFKLLDVKKHYKESLKAIKSGKHLNADQVLFFYDDYTLQHIFSLCADKEPLKEFCHPSVFTLMDYDSKNGTSYVKSLYSYIMAFKSPSELAASMHVHRNTLYYRISKIEEIMNIDLNNVDDFFNIYLSFKILEYMGEYIP